MTEARSREILRAEGVPAKPPPGQRPGLMLEQRDGQWGIAMLHGGAAIYWAPPAEFRAFLTDGLEHARLASDPGSLPGVVE